jgi:hypothetical protein
MVVVVVKENNERRGQGAGAIFSDRRDGATTLAVSANY